MPSESGVHGWLESRWFESETPILWLRPLAFLYGLLTRIRRGLYGAGVLRTTVLPCPVLVVGNITVGGTGKTPLVLWLYRWLESQGQRPGVVSRGYGGRGAKGPLPVSVDSDPAEVGDEPVLLARRGVRRLAVAPDRVAAARFLLEHSDCNVIVCDDGLQHYALGRDLEIAVVDGERRFGNGGLLPAGPLREPVSRLDRVDLVVNNGGNAAGEHVMELAARWIEPVNPGRRETPRSFGKLRGQRFHGVAGIGNPRRFFAMLRDADIQVTPHAFPDHHVFSRADLSFGDDQPVLMTEKDAVKCEEFDDGRLWFVPVDAELDKGFETALGQHLARIMT